MFRALGHANRGLFVDGQMPIPHNAMGGIRTKSGKVWL